MKAPTASEDLQLHLNRLFDMKNNPDINHAAEAIDIDFWMPNLQEKRNLYTEVYLQACVCVLWGRVPAVEITHP